MTYSSLQIKLQRYDLEDLIRRRKRMLEYAKRWKVDPDPDTLSDLNTAIRQHEDRLVHMVENERY